MRSQPLLPWKRLAFSYLTVTLFGAAFVPNERLPAALLFLSASALVLGIIALIDYGAPSLARIRSRDARDQHRADPAPCRPSDQQR